MPGEPGLLLAVVSALTGEGPFPEQAGGSVMTRIVWLSSLVLMLLAADRSWCVAPPVLGPVRLSARQQRQIDALQEQLSRAAATGRFEEAAEAAGRVVALREKWQGKKHWQTINARLGAEEWQRSTKVPVGDRAEALRASRLGHEGTRLYGQGRFREAEQKMREALAIMNKVLGEEHPVTITACNNLASCLDHQGKHADALMLHRRALALSRMVLGEQHTNTAGSYSNLAGCLDNQGKHAQALPLYEKALAIQRLALGEEHPDTATGYNNVAYCLADQGGLPEAVRLLQESLPGQEAARFHIAPSGFDRALASRHGSAHALLAAGLARLKQPINAYRHAEASLARALLDDLAHAGPGDTDRLASLSAQLRRLDDKALPLFGRDDLSAAQQRLRGELDRQRRAVLSQLSRLAAAVSARQLVPLPELQVRLPDDAALVLWLDEPYLRQQWACVVRRDGPPAWVLLSGSGKAGAWTADDLSLTTRLVEAVADPQTSAADLDRLTAALRRQRFEPLRPHLAARGMLPAARRLFVVPTGAMAHVPVEMLAPDCTVSSVPSGSILSRLLRQHRPLKADRLLALGDPVFEVPANVAEPPAHGVMLRSVLPGSNAARAGLQAGDVLLSVGKQRLQSADDLKEALARRAAPAVCWREGKEFPIRLPTGALGAVVDERSARAAVRAFRRQTAVLAQRGTGHRRLPGTRMEVASIARLVPTATTLLGSDASEQQLDRLLASGKLKGFRLLHLATHGEFDSRDPDRCRLILAQDQLPRPQVGQKVYTGVLTVKAIRQHWGLDADLVVLSACQTALGREAAGEGLLGFAHAFLSRGARAVVLSRWKVDDSATALLMVRFYENLLGKRKGVKAMGRAQALQEAKAWLRQLPRERAEKYVASLAGGVLRGTEGDVKPVVKGKPVQLPGGDRPYEHPYFWAAWALVGDAS